MRGMDCQRCGRGIPPASQYCNYCGKRQRWFFTRVFLPSGRINRTGLFVFTICALALGAYALVSTAVGTARANAGDGSMASVYTGFFGYLGLQTWVWLVTYAKRLHDWGRSGWWSLLMFIPIANLAFHVVLQAKKGDAGPNRFGPPPGDRLI